MPVTKTISRLLLVTLFTAFLLLPIFVTGIEKAYAADGVWVDAVTIEIAGEKYIDDELGSMEYYLNGERECSSFANGFSDDYWDGGREDTTARYNPRTRNAVSGYCENGENETLNLSRVENSHILAHWIDSGALVMVEGFRVTGIGGEILTSLSSKLSGAVLEKVEGHDNVFALTEGECRSSVTVTSTGSGDTAGQGTLRLRLGEGENNCGEDGGVDIAIRIGSPANAALDPGSGERPSDVADGLDDSCESNGSVLGWIMCPVSNLLDGAVNWLDNTIQGLLIVEEERYENEGLFKAWKQVRNIAYIILIPIMLVMVIGTALGFEVFSAYTIKRALPRMVIAVIFITLSWYICTFLIDFFNVVGTGVLGLITSPFDNIQSGLRGALELAGIVKDGGSADGEAAQGLGLVALVGTAGVVGFATGAVTLGIILSTLFSAALVLLFVFFILVARQMFILLFLLAAPLAILAWIFPGNDKMWKLWWSSFSKLLIMFPLVMAIIGLGRVFATVVGSAASGDNDNQIVTMLIIVAAYIIPFAAIPFTFKWVGGLFGNLAGMVNDKNRGLLDRGKKKRAETRAEGWNKFKSGTGTGFAQKNAFTRRVGMGVGAGVGGGKGIAGFGKKGAARLDQMNRQNSVDAIMKSPNWRGVENDDNALHAGVLLQDMSKDDARKTMLSRMGYNKAKETDMSLTQDERDKARVSNQNALTEANRAITAWGASGLGGRAAAIAAAQQLVSTGTGFKGGYTDQATGREVSDLEYMTQTLGRAAGGNTSTGSALAGFANSEAKKNGNFQLAPGFGEVQKATLSSVKGSGKPAITADEWSDMNTKAWDSGSLYEHANAKPHNLDSHIKHFEKELTSSDAKKVEKAATFFAELKAMQPNAKGVVADKINDTLAKNASRLESMNSTQVIDVFTDPITGASTTVPRTKEITRRSTTDPNVLERTTVPVTYGELIQQRARTYERLDPNNMPQA